MRPQAIYPVRPKMNSNESLVGYVTRFFISNGHHVSRDIFNTVYSFYYGKETQLSFSLIDIWIGDSAQLSQSWVKEREEQKQSARPLPAWQKTKGLRVRLCPLCLKEDGFHHYIWELPLVHACPKHACKLVSVCPSCRRPFSWLRLQDTWCCGCGNSIVDIYPTEASQWETQLAEVIASANLVFPSCIKESDSGYFLEDVYGAIAWAYYLRAVLVDGKQICPNWPERCSKLKRKPGRWEANMVLGAGAILGAFRSLARLRFHGHEGILVELSIYAPETRLFSFMSRLDSEGHVFAQTIQQCFETFLKSSCAVVSPSFELYYHPRLSGNARTKAISIFCSWWNSIYPSAAKFNKNILGAHSGRYRGLTKSRQIVDILNCLIDCSNRNCSEEMLQNFLGTWNSSLYLMRPLNAGEVLQMLAEHFSLKTPLEIDELYDALLADVVAWQ